MHMNEYPGWEDRFHTYILGQNTESWLCFTTDFDQALDVAASTAATFADLTADKKYNNPQINRHPRNIFPTP
ncbi:hypothetical protein HanIR_Chr01g0028251 [Helianthus annuus]|nr:hypothetical protein HanIR_Chr01g0028251 [Helianthus annuus]